MDATSILGQTGEVQSRQSHNDIAHDGIIL